MRDWCVGRPLLMEILSVSRLAAVCCLTVVGVNQLRGKRFSMTTSDKELARYVEFLKKAENKILRARVPTKQNHTTAEERRRLIELGKPIGTAS